MKCDGLFTKKCFSKTSVFKSYQMFAKKKQTKRKIRKKVHLHAVFKLMNHLGRAETTEAAAFFI